MDRFNKLIDRIDDSINTLREAIKGTTVMNVDLEKMYNDFINNQVPELWSNFAYPSLKPLASWYMDMTERVEFIREWLTGGFPTSF